MIVHLGRIQERKVLISRFVRRGLCQRPHFCSDDAFGVDDPGFSDKADAV